MSHEHPPQRPPRPPYAPFRPHRRPPPPPRSPGGEYLLPWQSSSTPPPPRWTTPPAAPVPAPGHHSDLRRLRGAYKVLRRVSTLTALGYFTLFLLLSGFTPGLMTRPVGEGGLTVGLLLGLCQLPVTLAAIAVYEWTARRTVDPLSAGLRDRARDTDDRAGTDRRGRGAAR